MENLSGLESLEDAVSSGDSPGSSQGMGLPSSFLERFGFSSVDRNPFSSLALVLAVVSVCAVLSSGAVPGHPSWLTATGLVTWAAAAVLGSWGWHRRSLYVHSSWGCLAGLALALVSAVAVAALGARTFNSLWEAIGLLAATSTVAALAWSSSSESSRVVRVTLTAAALALCVPAAANAALVFSGCSLEETLGSCRDQYTPWTAVTTPVLYEGQEVPSLLVESAPEGWFTSEMFDIAVAVKRGVDDGSIRFEGEGVLMTSEGEITQESESPLIYVSFSTPLQWMCVTDGTVYYDTYTAKVLPVSDASATFPARDCDENYPGLPTWQDYPPPQVSQLSTLVPVVAFTRSALAAGGLTGEFGGVLTSQSDVMDTRGYSGWYDAQGGFCVTDGATVYSTDSGKFIAGSSCEP